MDNIEINLKLNVAQVNAILAHLAKGAYTDVADLITNIREQALPQFNAAQAAAADEDRLEEDQAK